MSRQKRYFDHPASRRQALFDVTLEHDGAWRDPMAIEMIAKNYAVDLAWLTAECEKFEVEYIARLDMQSVSRDCAGA